MCCLVNSCGGGNGHVAAQVKGPTTHPPVMTTETGGLSALSFVPLEIGEHLLFVTFENINIPGDSKLCDYSRLWPLFTIGLKYFLLHCYM